MVSWFEHVHRKEKMLWKEITLVEVSWRKTFFSPNAIVWFLTTKLFWWTAFPERSIYAGRTNGKDAPCNHRQTKDWNHEVPKNIKTLPVPGVRNPCRDKSSRIAQTAKRHWAAVKKYGFADTRQFLEKLRCKVSCSICPSFAQSPLWSRKTLTQESQNRDKFDSAKLL